MKHFVRSFLVFALFFSTALTLCAQKADPELLDIKLTILSGQLKLTRVGTSETALIKEPVQLYSGDIIETLREAKAVLNYSDGTEMRIKPRTMVEVRPTSLRVFKGRTWYRFVKRGSEFRIETPTLVAGIRGTEFEVSVSSKNKSFLMVMHGAVAAKSKISNKGVLLRPGFAVHCDAGKDLSSPYSFDVETRKQDWTDSLWQNGSEKDDINTRFIRYLNYKYEYGDEDPKTLDALEQLNEIKNSNNK